MALRRVSDRYDRGADIAKGTVEYQLRFIGDNLHHLRNVDRGGKMERAAHDFARMQSAGESFTPGMMSYIDAIYEKTMKGAQYDSMNTHVDKKRRSLRFGALQKKG